jgi:nitrate reductase NapAB chaperone NapD
MAIAGAVVVPVRKEFEEILKGRLNSLKGVEVHGIGENGIAIVMEAEDMDRLRQLSEEIEQWKEVIDLRLSYINWEEEMDKIQN